MVGFTNDLIRDFTVRMSNNPILDSQKLLFGLLKILRLVKSFIKSLVKSTMIVFPLLIVHCFVLQSARDHRVQLLHRSAESNLVEAICKL
jgi:hypothetical protein